MVINKRIACGVLLTAALCTAGLAASAGDSHARYVNRAAWYTVAEPTENQVTSDCLELVTQPLLINLLGQMSKEKQEVPITLSSGQNLSGALTWTVSQPQYLNVGMRIGSTELACGDTIGLSKGKATTAVMTMEPTELGLSAQKAGTVDIQITWKDALTAVFRVELPVTADATGEETASLPSVQLETVKTYHTESHFPLRLTGGVDTQVQLGMASQAPFPAGTRFSLDGGGSWYRLGQEGRIPVDLPASEPVSMLLDLSRTPLVREQAITISTGDGSQVSLEANPQPLYELSSKILTASNPIQIYLTDAWEDCDLDYSVDMLVAGEAEKAYIPVELTEERLNVTYSREEDGSRLTLSVGQTLPQPGTYRIHLRWSDDGLCFQRTQITFFINYSEQNLSQQAGGAQL